ncbi:MAG: nitroreductase [Microscillaceae bacterium]|nr:nitroreductase [Microscillaceae bacterium]MDW8460169.1 nitroreductase [Cytophagales bacterium]
MYRDYPAIINEIIAQRRSTPPTQFCETPLPNNLIWQLLENANRAPTHGRTEPWRFVVFEGKGLQKLADFQSELYKRLTPADKFSEITYQKLQTDPLRASHVIAICMKRQESGKIPEIEEIEAVACAVENMYLTAEAYRIGIYWRTGGITYYEEAKPFFGLSPQDKLLGFLYLGNIAKPSPISERRPIQEKVTWVSE